MVSLANRNIVVTGLEEFVGRPVAETLAAEGARVLASDPGFADPEKRAAFEAENPSFLAAASTEPDVLAAEALERFEGRVDVLVSNDGFPAIRAPVAEAEAGDMRDGLEALVVRPFALAGKLVPAMRAAGGGRLLFVTSAAPLVGLPNYGMYATARGAQNAMVKSLARELARDNILVNAIAPNFVESPTYFPEELLADEAARAKILKNIPLGRLGAPREVAELVAFFASDKCGFVSGHVLPVAGGWA
ncbi:SDR family oxidoreductase [Marivibrio halodurans]|uniref:SDR family oxidoreductase n=1 Tax=Marivibrio halodurans TaxID=2039722 RepID=A0A8J7V4E2_9PROT|nr:SDR family oxidoreductase [Marivibrio halodurans]MBP5857599.1 SDR family oxidoreductase [Marivibrio halodurans]